MLLLHQIGSVKIGEVVRYRVTYTPAHDRILPAPEYLYLRIRNVSNSALRAAFVHGPYTLYVDAYPASFHPNEKFDSPRHYGMPEFEPMLKAGGSWSCRLTVPESIRHDAGSGGDGPYDDVAVQAQAHDPPSASWIINVSSQVIFSTSAAVHYEVLLARDPKSLDVGGSFVASIPSLLGGGNSTTTAPTSSATTTTTTTNGEESSDGSGQNLQPGRVSDYQRGRDGHHPDQPKGVFSRAIRMQLEDTAALWNKPRLPGWDGPAGVRMGGAVAAATTAGQAEKLAKKKKVHLVVLTHGLHSNLGADMLFLKESIDEAVKQAKVDRRARRAREREAALAEGKEVPKEEDEEDDEEVVVRGYSGNATRTERGIKYLGKRLARYVLAMTYPDQPFLPSKTSLVEPSPTVLRRRANDVPAGKDSSTETNGIRMRPPSRQVMQRPELHRGYKFTQISFVAHSLGGLVQTYAVAYIQKHSPQFFDLIKPINFIAMASPFLGLNHENPLYVKFALDFGLVGRSGQDLGLTWRPPTLARSGWGALVGNLGDNGAKKAGEGQRQPESKPLLRILPTGPAHTALKKFRSRTVYSNVVNDGIVPLRTSCLLFLDWQGLGRVEKARREAGLVESVVGFGWAELTGANVITPREDRWAESDGAAEVPLPPSNATLEDDRQSMRAVLLADAADATGWLPTASTSNSNPFSNFLNLFRGGSSESTPTSPQPLPRAASPADLHASTNHGSHHTPSPHGPSRKQNKIYQRSQTLRSDAWTALGGAGTVETATTVVASRVTSGQEFDGSVSGSGSDGVGQATDSVVAPPPKTSFFESAADLLNPKVPSMEYLIDPMKRPRTIFHDRMYHPSDIPAPPMKIRSPSNALMGRRALTFQRRTTGLSATNAASGSGNSPGPTSASRSSSPFAFMSRQGSASSVHDYNDTGNEINSQQADEVIDSASMKVEEKIARAYHRGLSWRKVLVKLEPDAHNNIIVRRMFANAFGWPVVKHMVDAHFSDAAAVAAQLAAEDDSEHALPLDQAPGEHGEETKGEDVEAKEEEGKGKEKEKTAESAEASAESAHPTKGLQVPGCGSPALGTPLSLAWSERDWDVTDYSSDEPGERKDESGGRKDKGKAVEAHAKIE